MPAAAFRRLDLRGPALHDALECERASALDPNLAGEASTQGRVPPAQHDCQTRIQIHAVGRGDNAEPAGRLSRRAGICSSHAKGRAGSPLRAVVNPWASAGKGLPALPPGSLRLSPVGLRLWGERTRTACCGSSMRVGRVPTCRGAPPSAPRLAAAARHRDARPPHCPFALVPTTTLDMNPQNSLRAARPTIVSALQSNPTPPHVGKDAFHPRP